MFCSKCGSELPDNAKFCGKCGTSIATDEKMLSGKTISPAMPEASANKAQHKDDANAKRLPLKRFFIMLAVMIVAILEIVLTAQQKTYEIQYS